MQVRVRLFSSLLNKLSPYSQILKKVNIHISNSNNHHNYNTYNKIFKYLMR